jgi:hypothetical protein
MISLSGRVPGRASGPFRSRDDDGGLQYVSWKSVPSFRVFPTKGIYRRKGDVRGGPGPTPPGGAARGGPCHPMVQPPLGSAPSLLWTLSSFQVNRNFSETQKQQKTGTDTVSSR